MTESRYIQHVRQMVRDFNAANQQCKTAEERAQQTYQFECEAADAELRERQHTLNMAKAGAKTRYESACQEVERILKNARADVVKS